MPTLPNVANPFQPAAGASPPFLAGRAAELAAIWDAATRAAQHSAPVAMVFLGLRGLGKTVLLNELKRQSEAGIHLSVEVESGVPLAVSLHHAIAALDATLQRPAQRLTKAVAQALRVLPLPGYELPHGAGELRLSIPPVERAQPQDLPIGQAVGVLNDAASAARKYLVITIDEIQDVDVSGLRSLAARVHQSASSPAPIVLACAGLPESTHVIRSLRTYARTRWDRFDLSFLSRAESAEAIRVPLQKVGVEIEDAALDRIVAESAGYPFFVQRYASAAWNAGNHKLITLADAEDGIGKARPMIDKLFYADEFNRLSPRERRFCKALADLGPGAHPLGSVSVAFGVPSSQISSIRTTLLRKGLIYSPRSGEVEFRMPLADRYVREHPAEFGIEPRSR